MYTTDEAEVNRAICDAALAQAAHGWDHVTMPDDPTDYAEECEPDAEDRSWACSTCPLNQPEDETRWANVLDLDADAAGRIYQTMPDFESWDTHRLIAWHYAIAFTLRERLA